MYEHLNARFVLSLASTNKSQFKDILLTKQHASYLEGNFVCSFAPTKKSYSQTFSDEYLEVLCAHDSFGFMATNINCVIVNVA